MCQDLMLAFNAPAFQRQLHDFARQFEKGSAGFRKALLPLVRSDGLVQRRSETHCDIETPHVFPIKFGDLLVLNVMDGLLGEGMIITSEYG